MHKRSPSLTAVLHGSGLRNTPQRALIYQILSQASEHLDAEGIWRLAQQQDAKVNLATVYRTLHHFIKAGLVRQSYLSEDLKRAYYEVNKPNEHVHFVCVSCGAVLEMEDEKVHQLFQQFEDEYQVQILRQYVQMEGLCKDCLENSN